MTVVRRLDAVLEPTKQAVLDMKANLDKAGITNQDAALRQAAGQAFYNTSRFTLRDLRARANRQQLTSDFEAYLDGFSGSVQEILENFEVRNQISRLSKADALGTLIEKFLDPAINLGPKPVLNSDNSVKLAGLDNHAMGTLFEELVRRFNEENNEEAGEHWTPRDAVRLMSRLIFEPVADQIESGSYLLYDGACGTGGMLTVAEETLVSLAEARGKQVAAHLYGQEINPETYAIAKADLLLMGEGEAADNLVGGSEWSTLSNDAFPSREFDFMLSNPPYGKSWRSDQERMGGKRGVRDPRFVIEHAGDPEYSLITRSNDGQMLFLANLLSKMKHGTKLGSRIAEVHNGSSLFTGDAGQGESNVRRWIIENDWLEAIVSLPLNMFYNTGIATYVWVLTNRKPSHRKGKIQLIDAMASFKPLRRNLGKKNCELSQNDIDRILKAFIGFEETEQSKIFDAATFGYWKVTVERPLRLTCRFTRARVDALRFQSNHRELRELLHAEFGDALFDDFPSVLDSVKNFLDPPELEADETDPGADDAHPTASAASRTSSKAIKKLLDTTTWSRDRRLQRAAEDLMKIVGEDEYDDYSVFEAMVRGAALTASVESVLGAIQVAPLGPPVDRRYATLRAGREAIGQSMGANDLWIAAHAIALGCVLVTHDGAFAGIAGLAIEDWLTD
jgi:type I restriction enzyme M protein